MASSLIQKVEGAKRQRRWAGNGHVGLFLGTWAVALMKDEKKLRSGGIRVYSVGRPGCQMEILVELNCLGGV